MARAKYFNEQTQKWEYMDIANTVVESKYTLPVASASTLGGIKVGENLNITADGTLNAQAGGGGGIPATIETLWEGNWETEQPHLHLSKSVEEFDIISFVFNVDMSSENKDISKETRHILTKDIIYTDQNALKHSYNLYTANGNTNSSSFYRFLYTFRSPTEVQINTTGKLNWLNPKITKITGIKLGTGGTGGGISEWNNIAGTLTFTKFEYMTLSATTSSDLTNVLSLGSKLKFTNEGKTKYGIVTGLTASTIDVFLGTDYTAVAGITDVQYSNMKMPHGFPTDPNKWTFTYLGTKTDSLDNPPVQTIINLGGNSFTVPKGAWNICYNSGYQLGHANTPATANYVFAGLGTKPTGKLGDKEAIISVFKDRIAFQGTFIAKLFNINVPYYTVSKPTKFYHNICNEGYDSKAGAGKILYSGTCEFKAVCAYL